MKDKILVVDDDPAIREYLVLGLAADYEMYEAADARAARRAFRREIPALVFLDVQLPDASGLELIETFTNSGSPTVVIMLTSSEDLDIARRALDHGASEYVTKPCSLSDIRRIAGRRLRRLKEEENAQDGLPWRVAK